MRTGTTRTGNDKRSGNATDDVLIRSFSPNGKLVKIKIVERIATGASRDVQAEVDTDIKQEEFGVYRWE